MTRVVNDLLAATGNKTPSILLSLEVNATFHTIDHRRLNERMKDLFGLGDKALE